VTRCRHIPAYFSEDGLTVNILIADDHGLLRAGLRSLLNAESDLRVVGEAPDGNTALTLVHQLEPDVLLADISMPGASGIEVARTLRQQMSDTRVLIVSMHEDEGIVREAMAAGAVGYLPKRAAETELISAIRTIVKGSTYVPAALQPRTVVPPVRPTPSADLDDEELKLLRLLAHGAINARIAEELGISTDEASERRAQLFQKLGLRSRVDLVRYAQDHRLM
jgi:DNA-binding NarL/FixJ family response regulator